MRLTLFFWLDISNLYQLSWSEHIPDPYWTSIHHCFQLSVAKVIMVWRCIKQSLLQEPGNYISWCYMFHYPFLYTKSWIFFGKCNQNLFPIWAPPPPNKKRSYCKCSEQVSLCPFCLVRYSGPTIHFVDEHYDTGRILAQRVVPVLANDTAEELAARVLHEVMKQYSFFFSFFLWTNTF